MRTLRGRWICVDLIKEYLDGSLGRFKLTGQERKLAMKNASKYYQVPRPGILWNGEAGDKLREDGGIKREKENKDHTFYSNIHSTKMDEVKKYRSKQLSLSEKLKLK